MTIRHALSPPAALLAGLGLIAPGFAPAAGAEGASRSAQLTLVAQRDGSLAASLMVWPPEAASPEVQDAMERIFAGRLQVASTRQVGQVWLLHGTAPRFFARRGLLREGTLTVAPLTAALEGAEVERLSVSFGHPRAPWSRLGTGEASGESGSNRGRSLSLELGRGAPAPLELVFGFRSRDLALPLGVLLATFLLPVAFIVWRRAVALRADLGDPARVWFEYARAVYGVSLALWPAWLAAVHWAGSAALAEAALSSVPPPFFASLQWTILMIPPLAAGLMIASLTHAVSTRVRGTSQKPGEGVRQGAARVAALLAVMLGISLAVSAFAAEAPRTAALAMLLAVAGAMLLARLQARAPGASARAVTHGELRDRIFALATRAGVKLQQLYLLPMVPARMANAFAVRNDVVILTDYLLQHIGRREVDALMAHEIAHLKRRHPQRTALAGVATGAVLLTVLNFVSPALAGPVALAAVPLAMVVVARRFEYAADAGAVELCGDPEAFITGLARLNRLNHLPLAWGGVTAQVLTHPSTERRARAIGRRAGLDPVRIDQLLRPAEEPEAPYALPATAQGAGKLFSSAFKQRAATGVTLQLVALTVLAPALVAMAAGATGALPRAGVLALAIIASVAVSLLGWNLLASRPYRALRAGLRARLEGEGVEPSRGVFVGLSPDATPRVYEGFSDWDVGFLDLRDDRLCYFGEEMRFALRRDDVTALGLDPGLPGWIPARRVSVRWHDAASGREGCVRLRPAVATTVTGSARQTHRLLAGIAAWKRGEAAPDLLADPGRSAAPAASGALAPDATAIRSVTPLAPLGPPAIGEVTSLSPRAIAAASTLPLAFVMVALFAACAAGLLGLPFAPARGPGFAEILAAAWVATIVQRIPYWRYRDPAARGEAADERPRRAA